MAATYRSGLYDPSGQAIDVTSIRTLHAGMFTERARASEMRTTPDRRRALDNVLTRENAALCHRGAAVAAMHPRLDPLDRTRAARTLSIACVPAAVFGFVVMLPTITPYNFR